MDKRTFIKMSALMGAGALIKSNSSGRNQFGINTKLVDSQEMISIKEASSYVSVLDEVDVLVCGGGLGGVAAAIASARTGAKTLLVERNTCLGGVATAGMCCSVFNCYFTGGKDRKLVTRGIALEIADAFANTTDAG